LSRKDGPYYTKQFPYLGFFISKLDDLYMRYGNGKYVYSEIEDEAGEEPSE